jgi:hypothetical protein
MHTFEMSGLGKSPFRYIAAATRKEIKSVNGVFFCQHCGTPLTNRHLVKSSNGIVSIVGIDCLKKTDDSGLIDGAKRSIREAKTLIKQNEWNTKLEVRSTAERIKNNGKTNGELLESLRTKKERLTKKFREDLEDNDIIIMLGNSHFAVEMYDQARRAKPYTENQITTIEKICAKAYSNRARANSNEFKEALAEIKPLVKKLQRKITAKFKKDADIQTQIIAIYK